MQQEKGQWIMYGFPFFPPLSRYLMYPMLELTLQVFTNALNACHAMHHPASSHRPFLIGIPLLSLWSSWTSDAGASDTSSVTARNKAQEFSWRDWPCYNVLEIKTQQHSYLLQSNTQAHRGWCSWRPNMAPPSWEVDVCLRCLSRNSKD